MKNQDSENSKSTESSKTPKQSWYRLFFSAQVAAFLGTAVDFLTIIFFTEIIGLWYIYSNVIGAALGAITNFLLGRYWVFDSKEKKIHHQAFRYFLVATGSMILNTLGLWFLTEFTALYYVTAKVIVAVLIAFTFNFFLQKNFVFK